MPYKLTLRQPAARSTNPSISVIISLYNYERYIGECLDSILAQTFQDFEVIVADDCSTDSSCAIVESYMPKFGGRLKLVHTETNSGGGGEPRNLGFSLSRGEYVFFMDADDVFTPTALEELYTLAKNYNADVVYCEKYFMSSGVGQEFVDNIHLADMKIQKPPFVEEPTLETTDLAECVNGLIKLRYWMTPWLRLVSRDLLTANGIKFPSLIGSNDVAWTYEVLFCAKRFLRVPNAVYIRRIHDASVSFRERTTPDLVHKWMDRTIRSLKDIDDFMAGIEFFRDNPVHRYNIIYDCLKTDFDHIFPECKKETAFNVYGIFLEKFGDYLGKHDVLVACLCAYVIRQRKSLSNKYNKYVRETQQRIDALEAEIARLNAKE